MSHHQPLSAEDQALANLSAPVWHKLHNDPADAVVIRSQDGVHFRANGKALERESSLFAGMLSFHPTSQMSDFNPILLDFTSSSISIFLDCYQTPTNRHNLEHLSILELYEYRKLLSHLYCCRLIRSADAAYAAACNENPIFWLLAASWENDLTGAVQALGRCGEVVEGYFAGLDWAGRMRDLVGGVRPQWRHALMSCLISASGEGDFGVSWPDKCRVRVFEETVLQDEREGQAGEWLE